MNVGIYYYSYSLLGRGGGEVSPPMHRLPKLVCIHAGGYSAIHTYSVHIKMNMSTVMNVSLFLFLQPTSSSARVVQYNNIFSSFPPDGTYVDDFVVATALLFAIHCTSHPTKTSDRQMIISFHFCFLSLQLAIFNSIRGDDFVLPWLLSLLCNKQKLWYNAPLLICSSFSIVKRIGSNFTVRTNWGQFLKSREQRGKWNFNDNKIETLNGSKNHGSCVT